MALNLMS